MFCIQFFINFTIQNNCTIHYRYGTVVLFRNIILLHSSPWQFLLSRPHHLVHKNCHFKPRSAKISLTITSHATILPLGSVHFGIFCEKSHDFYHWFLLHDCHHGQRWGKWDFSQCKLIFIVIVPSIILQIIAHRFPHCYSCLWSPRWAAWQAFNQLHHIWQ